MKAEELQVIVVDDDIYKSNDIKKALEYNGITHITMLENQEDVWKEIESERRIDLIVTDMHYPLAPGLVADHKAGFILLDKMKEREINIPVIICSTINYSSSEVVGTVWYNKMKDIQFDFREILQKMDIN